MGRPLPGYRIRLVDPDGAEAEEGEIALALDPAPLGLMQGYLRRGRHGRSRPRARSTAPATSRCATRTAA